MCTPGTCNAEDPPDVRREGGREGGVSSFRWEKGVRPEGGREGGREGSGGDGSPTNVHMASFFPPTLPSSLLV